jgi:hypothetical protein
MEFEHVPHVSHSQHATPSGSGLKGLLKKKPKWVIFGAVGVLLLVVIQKLRSPKVVQETAAPSEEYTPASVPTGYGGYPTPSGSMLDDLANNTTSLDTFSSMIQENMKTQLDSLVTQKLSDYETKNQAYLDKVQQTITDTINNVNNKNEAITKSPTDHELHVQHLLHVAHENHVAQEKPVVTSKPVNAAKAEAGAKSTLPKPTPAPTLSQHQQHVLHEQHLNHVAQQKKK